MHLEEHKRSQLFPEIESIKNARVKCIRKVHKLSELFNGQLGAMDGPKSIEKICSESTDGYQRSYCEAGADQNIHDAKHRCVLRLTLRIS